VGHDTTQTICGHLLRKRTNKGGMMMMMMMMIEEEDYNRIAGCRDFINTTM
jgi:hypothetical protein